MKYNYPYPQRLMMADQLGNAIEKQISRGCHVLINREDVIVTFNPELSPAEKTVLDTIVTNHTSTSPIVETIGLHLSSPDGSSWSVTIDNAGLLKTKKKVKS